MKSSVCVIILFSTLSFSLSFPTRLNPRTVNIGLSARAGPQPMYDPTKQLWIPPPDASYQDDPSAYPPSGSLLRQGPIPFFIRLTNPLKYEQAVLKYIAETGCSRGVAQGNMDAYFENPTSWVLQKMEEKKGKEVYDYENNNTKPQQIYLTMAWALLLFTITSRLVMFQMGILN